MHWGKFLDCVVFGKLESQLQGWGMYKNSKSSDHYALDQRSWCCKANWRTHDIAIDCGTNWFPWLRYDRYDGCVFIAKAFQHADTASVEEQQTQKHDRFLRGRQIACMICYYFRAIGAHEAVNRLSDLFTLSLQNDDVQDLDVGWDQAPLSVSEMLSNVIWEDCTSPHEWVFLNFRLWALCDQETARNNDRPSYSRFKIVVKIHIDQRMRTQTLQMSDQCCGK